MTRQCPPPAPHIHTQLGVLQTSPRSRGYLGFIQTHWELQGGQPITPHHTHRSGTVLTAERTQGSRGQGQVGWGISRGFKYPLPGLEAHLLPSGPPPPSMIGISTKLLWHPTPSQALQRYAAQKASEADVASTFHPG